MSIKLLPPQLANQIAAGEVVERPASVVKELIENSIDAGATRIELDIEKGGHKRIRLRDNGCGIVKDELSLALSRHATSKIATLDDLEHILSLGFRGEALASISSVSRLTLTSLPQGQEQAWQAHCEGREMEVQVNPVAHPNGTTIDVADLFYNTPARRKFLRTEKTEFQHIEETVKRIALSHPEVAFILRHNGNTIKRFQSRENAALDERVSAVLGSRFINNAIHVTVDYDGMSIEAWLGNEATLRSSSDCQYSFVNGRSMKDKLILHGIRQAYESVWGVLEQPSFVVYLNVDPKDVDVNVHPAKNEVRFQRSRLVHDFISKTVADALAGDGENDETAQVRIKKESEPAHDYVRPLETLPTGNNVDGHYPCVSGGNRSAAAGTGSSGAGQRAMPTPRPSLENYAREYTALMSSNMDAAKSETLSFLQLHESARLYQHRGSCWLFNVRSYLPEWVLSNCVSAETSQPLLMPVAVAVPAVSEALLESLANCQFVINQVAGKYRLQQVPAGTRHYPWIGLFPAMLTCESTVLKDIFRHALAQTAINDELASQVWRTVDAFSFSEQVGLVEQHATEKTIDELTSRWKEI